MKRTEKEICDFVNKKLEEAKDKLAKIGDGYKYSDNLDTECCVLEAKAKAYEEVLNFVGAIGTEGERTMNEQKVLEKARAYRLAQQAWKLSLEGDDNEKSAALFRELEERENELLGAAIEE